MGFNSHKIRTALPTLPWENSHVSEPYINWTDREGEGKEIDIEKCTDIIEGNEERLYN